MTTDAEFDGIQKILPHMSNNRDNGNAAAIREALYDIVMLTMKVGHSIHGDVACGIIASKAKHALSKPPRQCDIGTADEQERRFEKFCDSHKWVDDDGANACSSDCPLYKTVDCALHWAQMPYEEGCAK